MGACKLDLDKGYFYQVLGTEGVTRVHHEYIAAVRSFVRLFPSPRNAPGTWGKWPPRLCSLCVPGTVRMLEFIREKDPVLAFKGFSVESRARRTCMRFWELREGTAKPAVQEWERSGS